MDFAYPELLYLLFIIPVFIGLFLLARFSRRKKIARYGSPDVVKSMMPEASKYKPTIKIILESIVIAALIVVVARPRGGEREEQEEHSGIEVMIALDLSQSMLASSTDDARGVSRLNRAKFLLGRLLDRLDNDKIGLIVFGGEAYTQLPITSDFVSAKMYIDELNTQMIPTQGTDIGKAIAMALNGFTPQEDINKAIVLITDCEDHEAQAIDMAKKAHEAGVQVDVIGIGTTKQMPIPVGGKNDQYLYDYNGNIALTSFNPEVARKIADAGGGVYVNGSASDAVSEIYDCLDKIKKTDFGVVKYKASAEQFPVFVWIALAFLVIDIFILDRKIGWLGKINFFSK